VRPVTASRCSFITSQTPNQMTKTMERSGSLHGQPRIAVVRSEGACDVLG
jgi:hypothetical protein